MLCIDVESFTMWEKELKSVKNGVWIIEQSKAKIKATRSIFWPWTKWRDRWKNVTESFSTAPFDVSPLCLLLACQHSFSDELNFMAPPWIITILMFTINSSLFIVEISMKMFFSSLFLMISVSAISFRGNCNKFVPYGEWSVCLHHHHHQAINVKSYGIMTNHCAFSVLFSVCFTSCRCFMMKHHQVSASFFFVLFRRIIPCTFSCTQQWVAVEGSLTFRTTSHQTLHHYIAFKLY